MSEGALLLTGGTGFLGMELLGRLLDEGDGPDIFLAVRGDARQRVDDLLSRLYDARPASAERIRPLAADLMQPGLGIAASERTALGKVERVVHCAASIAFTLPLAEARAVNVEGTRRVVELARDLPGLERFVHVSTAYVAGRRAGVFTETEAGGGDFRNSYEQSKSEAELVVAEYDLPSVVVRPSIVVGESGSGWTSAFNVLYWPLQAFARGLLDTAPADPHGVVDVVPVDHVAAVVEAATFAPDLDGSLHAVAAERALSVEQLIVASCRELDRPAPELVAPGSLDPDHPASVFAPYFDVATRFDDRRARGLVGTAPEPLEYLPRLLEFARVARWGKRVVTRQAAGFSAGEPAAAG